LGGCFEAEQARAACIHARSAGLHGSLPNYLRDDGRNDLTLLTEVVGIRIAAAPSG